VKLFNFQYNHQLITKHSNDITKLVPLGYHIKNTLYYQVITFYIKKAILSSYDILYQGKHCNEVMIYYTKKTLY
jgi:hypothetical protein